MKKWEKRLIREFKSGLTIYALADKYESKINGYFHLTINGLSHDGRESVVEEIIRDEINR